MIQFTLLPYKHQIVQVFRRTCHTSCSAFQWLVEQCSPMKDLWIEQCHNRRWIRYQMIPGEEHLPVKYYKDLIMYHEIKTKYLWYKKNYFVDNYTLFIFRMTERGRRSVNSFSVFFFSFRYVSTRSSYKSENLKCVLKHVMLENWKLI